MARGTASFVAIMLVGVLWAGCVGTSGGPQGVDGDELSAGGGAFVEGQVLDTELIPVAGALVTIDEGAHENMTDEDGRFRLGPVEPGEHLLVVERDGYAAQDTRVVVSPDGRVDPVTVMLSPVSMDVPYHLSEVYTTFIICWVSSAGFGNLPCTKIVDYLAGTNISSSETFWFTFEVENPGLVDMLVELTWEEQSTGTDMTFFIKTPPNQPFTALVTKYFQMWGAPPLRGWVEAGVSNGEGWEVFEAEPGKITYEGDTVSHHENGTVPFTAVYLNHRADTWLTFFHNRAGPRDFTALPDE